MKASCSALTCAADSIGLSFDPLLFGYEQNYTWASQFQPTFNSNSSRFEFQALLSDTWVLPWFLLKVQLRGRHWAGSHQPGIFDQTQMRKFEPENKTFKKIEPKAPTISTQNLDLAGFLPVWVENLSLTRGHENGIRSRTVCETEYTQHSYFSQNFSKSYILSECFGKSK